MLPLAFKILLSIYSLQTKAILELKNVWFIELSLCYRITMDGCCVYIHVYILGMHNYYHISASIRISTSTTAN